MADFNSYLTSFVVIVLGSMLNESADLHWSAPMGLSNQDVITPSLLLSTPSVVASYYAPPTIRVGLRANAAIGLLLNLKRFQSTTELFPLVLIALIIAVGVAWASYFGSRETFADFEY